MLLNKEQALYSNNGVNLEPVEYKLVDAFKKEDDKSEDIVVKLIPMTREQIKGFYTKATLNEDEEVTTTKDGDAELIEKHIVEPNFTKKELKFLKPQITRNLVLTILEASEQDISGFITLTSVKENKKIDDEWI